MGTIRFLFLFAKLNLRVCSHKIQQFQRAVFTIHVIGNAHTTFI